jgi:hypothetical protein
VVSRPSCGPAVHSATGCEELLLLKIERQQKLGKEAVFRADAAFAKPELCKALEQRDVEYAIRFPAHDNMQRSITELLTRPVGSQATSRWSGSRAFSIRRPVGRRRGGWVAKVGFHFGELFPRVGFIVTNPATSSRALLRFYNKRGTLVADQIAAAAGEKPADD